MKFGHRKEIRPVSIWAWTLKEPINKSNNKLYAFFVLSLACLVCFSVDEGYKVLVNEEKNKRLLFE